MTEIGDYRVVKKLGEGTFAEVLQAKNKRTGKYFALKRFKKQFRSVDEIESLREIQALRRLSMHPNIIQLEEVIFDAKYGILSLTFELMDHNLYDVLSKKGAPPVQEPRAKWIMWQVMKAMDFVHSKGVFHRDIKPENILVRGDIHAVPTPFPSPDPSSPYNSLSSFPLVKLADFGSCRGIHSRMPYTEYIATRWYRSPECLLFDGIYTYKMDIWGIGCVAFELVTKLPLFPGDNELDQLNRIHQILGTPSDRLLKVMVASGTQAMISTPNGQPNPKAAGHLTKGIFKQKFSFPQLKGTGLRAIFPQHILQGAHRVPLPKNNVNARVEDYPGISDSCINLIELLLQYDPDARPTTRQILKHPWLKECRDAEIVERQMNTSMKSMPVDLDKPDLLLPPISPQKGFSTMPRPPAGPVPATSSVTKEIEAIRQKRRSKISDIKIQGEESTEANGNLATINLNEQLMPVSQKKPSPIKPVEPQSTVPDSMLSPRSRKVSKISLPATKVTPQLSGIESTVEQLSITSPKQSHLTKKNSIKRGSIPPAPARTNADATSPKEPTMHDKIPHVSDTSTNVEYILDSTKKVDSESRSEATEAGGNSDDASRLKPRQSNNLQPVDISLITSNPTSSSILQVAKEEKVIVDDSKTVENAIKAAETAQVS